jgi:hypothetical protein
MPQADGHGGGRHVTKEAPENKGVSQGEAASRDPQLEAEGVEECELSPSPARELDLRSPKSPPERSMGEQRDGSKTGGSGELLL